MDGRRHVSCTTQVAVVWLSVLVCAGCASQQPLVRRAPTQPALGLYLRGLMMERSSRYSEALAAYQAALEHDRNSPLLHVRIGATYVKLGQTDHALEAFSQALALNPDQPDALRWVAMLHTSQGEIDQAVASYERLIQQEPTDQFVMNTLADLYVLQGQLPKAVEVYQRLIRDVGSSSQVHFNLGVLYGRLNQFTDAIAELSRAFELAPDSLEVRVALGLTYELSGQNDRAAAHYEAATRLDPLNPRLYHHAGRAHFNGKRWREAMADYQTALDLAPRDFEAIMGIVRVRMAQEQFEDAARFLGKKLAELNQPPELYVALGLVYREAKQGLEAMRAFERAVALKDDYDQAYFYLAAQLDQLGRRQEARAMLHRTIELNPNHPDALNYLGYLDAEAGVNLEEAKAFVERALTLDPDNGAYLDSLGWVYYQMGKIDEAITHLVRAAALLDSDPVVFDHLGDAYFKRHDVAHARQSWQHALELGADQAAIVDKLNQVNLHEVTATTHESNAPTQPH